MLHNTKLLMRRLAYVPWLLAVGLVLGWAGEAVANTDATAGHAPGDHTHATDPNMVLTYNLQADGEVGDDHSVTVTWSTSRTKNFGTNTDNGDPASNYTVSLHAGEIPDDIASVNSGNGIGTLGNLNATADRTHTFTAPEILYNGQPDPNNNDMLADGKYWVRMEVQVGGDNTTDMAYFAKQIVVQPDYVLSVNPGSVREDADATNVTVTASVGDGVPVKQDTDILLTFDNTGLNERWRGVRSLITIASGETAGSGTFVFTPVEDTDSITDLPIEITGRAQPNEIVESTELLLIDTDKPTTEIHLSFSHASLSKSDPTTSVVVTATLNGGRVRKDLRFPLIIDEVATAAAGLVRDVDYSAVPTTLTIPDRRVSGKATITISPKNKDTGSIWVKAGGDALVYNEPDHQG